MLGKYNLNVRAATEPDLIQWMKLGVPDNLRLFLAFLNFVLTSAYRGYLHLGHRSHLVAQKLGRRDEISEEIPKALPGEFTLKDAGQRLTKRPMRRATRAF